MGLLPHVHQRSPPETGYTAMGGGGRWNEISAMEYIYGGPSVAAGSQNYDLSRRFLSDEETDLYHIPLQVDTRLFPSGPAVTTHSRADPSLHPLLCGVDLPLINALVSDLLPHSTRAVRWSQTDQRRGVLGEMFQADRIRLTAGAGPFADSQSPHRMEYRDGVTKDCLLTAQSQTLALLLSKRSKSRCWFLGPAKGKLHKNRMFNNRQIRPLVSKVTVIPSIPRRVLSQVPIPIVPMTQGLPQDASFQSNRATERESQSDDHSVDVDSVGGAPNERGRLCIFACSKLVIITRPRGEYLF